LQVNKYIILLLVLGLGSLFSCAKQNGAELSDFDAQAHSIQGSPGISYHFPMVITPNGDYLNDVYQMVVCFEIPPPDEISHFKLKIKQNGKVVYDTQDPLFAWNGTSISGKEISGFTNVNVELGLNGNSAKEHKLKLYVHRGNCIPESMSGLSFGDMIDPRYGSIYNTQEPICP